MCTNNKIHKIFCVFQGKFTEIWIKLGELMCQFCVCYSSIYNLYMYKHETVKNRLISYLIFISVNRNLEKTDRLTGYSVKVHSTKLYSSHYCHQIVTNNYYIIVMLNYFIYHDVHR